MTLYELANAPKLLTPGGAVAISGTTESAVSTPDASATLTGILFRLELVCTVAGSTAGYFELRSSAAGTVLLRIYVGEGTPAAGTRIVEDFPIPWKSLNVATAFTLKPSVNTLGTWQAVVNGTMQPISNL